MNQCGICRYYYAEQGDYGYCLAKGKEISGYNRESCFTSRYGSVVDRRDRQERADSVHGVHEAELMSIDATHIKPEPYRY